MKYRCMNFSQMTVSCRIISFFLGEGDNRIFPPPPPPPEKNYLSATAMKDVCDDDNSANTLSVFQFAPSINNFFLPSIG